MTPPLASISIDCDNLWSYQRTHGDPEWKGRPSYLQVFIPRALDLLGRLDVKATFFLVGFDAEDPRNAAAFRAIPEAGHEVGNHSYDHEAWIHRWDRGRLLEEVTRAEEAIRGATGQTPVGFRGPAYRWSPDLLTVLQEHGYLYDASTLPTYLGPIARAYYFRRATLTDAERALRQGLFGTFADGIRPIKPFQWRLPGGTSLLEIPVTTFPVLKIPFHLSYLLYISRFSTAAMRSYLQAALAACRLTGTEPSFLLHPLDLMGCDEVRELAFFPGMDLPSRRKADLFAQVLRTLGEQFALVPLREHARAVLARPAQALAVRSPSPVRGCVPVGTNAYPSA